MVASLLSVGEFALAAGAGLAPLGPVQGADVRLVSVQLSPPRSTAGRWTAPSAAAQKAMVQAVPGLDAEVRDARRRVLDQMRGQAGALSADIVIGVHRLGESVAAERVRSSIDAAAGFAEKRAGRTSRLEIHGLLTQYAGSAARQATSRGTDVTPAEDIAMPLCTVSAEDYWKLDRGGWRAVGLVGGCSHWLGANTPVGWGVHELTGVSQAWESARCQAFAEMDAQVAALGADGVIGIDLQTVEHRHIWYAGTSAATSGRVVGVDVIGTAIKRIEHERTPAPGPVPILSLR